MRFLKFDVAYNFRLKMELVVSLDHLFMISLERLNGE